MIDTHCHLTFKGLHERLGEVIEGARKAGVTGMITVSTTSEDCVRARTVAEANQGVWFSAGVHPLYADQPRDWEVIRQASVHPKCVAWGELGLDNHYDDPPRKTQQAVLEEELTLLEELQNRGLQKPVIIHCRDAYAELIEVLRHTKLQPDRFVFHCFTGSPDEARGVLDFGAWISFTGIVTFSNARDVAEAAKLVPDDRIMVETDAPFLTPEPVRKIRPNEPKYVVHTARFLAELRRGNPEAFAGQLDQNAIEFFSLDPGAS